MTTTIQLHGKIYWRLVFEYPNLDNAGSITQSYLTKSYTEFRRSTFSETVSKTTTDVMQKAGVSAEVGASYGPVSAKVSASFETSKEVNDMLSNTTRSSSEEIVKTSSENLRKYEIGAHSKLSLFQQCFEGPGMSAAFDVFSTDTKRENQTQDITMDVDVEKIEFISNFKAVYTDNYSEMPNERLREMHAGNADVNSGFKGKYVWLVPEYTYKVSEAATAFEFIHQGQYDKRYYDLAKDAGGDYRYLIPVYDTREKKKITECTMLRSGGTWVTVEEVKKWGWADRTEDLNKDRGGSYLFILWKNRYAY